MIKKLRLKLMFAAMLSLLIVLTLILGTAAVLNYRQILSTADMTLSLLAENGGRFPDSLFLNGNSPRGSRRFSPELPYESRYFSVSLSGDGTILLINTGKIAAVGTPPLPRTMPRKWHSGAGPRALWGTTDTRSVPGTNRCRSFFWTAAGI